MDTNEANTQGTRDRLLTAACELFAEKGYRQTTVADICGRAGANIAAVNYHFRSKDELYVEAWRHSFAASLRAYPPDGGVPAEAPAEERFRGRILALLRRMLDPRCYEFRIVGHEMASPTGLLGEAMREAILPLRRAMLGIIRELLGEAVDEQTCLLCMMSVVGQCLHLLHREWHKRTLQLDDDALPIPGPGPASVEDLADHFTRFSLGGIRGIAAAARAGRIGRGGGAS